MRLGLIGAGNMASALAHGLAEPVIVADVDAAKARRLAEEVGGEAVGTNVEVARRADVVVLCHKPAQLAEVAAEIAAEARPVISILAATRIGQLEVAYPGAPVYRFIPNIPVAVGHGVLCYAPGSRAAEGPETEILELFERAGTVIPLDEPLLEPATALMSCGPAFMALVVESFAAAGSAHGLAPADATRMTVQTMAGTAAYLAGHELDTQDLIARVATPGGVTERGLRRLEVDGLRQLCRGAVDTVVKATR